ncbi:Transglycosylase [Mucilaginibacter mallensis]|uniref:Transglycosylase n=1 Tax=Mucilaginibacter mallensis TaxID=652787 RepID=A0A1H2CGS1_MUCMA|nr:biosynthetic peptidoglycan transglycosylase [Mucilaginibacter mallensis]SDT69700.1 Transglycosylase [Mucilaginibacter mallensis]
MHRLNPKYIRIALIVVISLIIIVLIGGYIAYTKRDAILQREIAKAKATAKTAYNIDLQIGSATFTGLSTVSFSNIVVVPQNRDSLLSIKKLEISVKLMPLIYGAVKLSDVDLEDGHLNLTDINKVKNFDFLFKKKKDSTATQTKGSLAELANKLINEFLYKIPDNLKLKNFLFTFTKDSTTLKLLTTTAAIKSGTLTSTINVNDGTATWHFEGKLHPSDKEIDVKLYADGKKVELPGIEEHYHTKLSFDTITTQLTKVERGGGETRIYGSWSVSNLLISNRKLATNDIVVPSASIDANVFVGANYISLDSSSVIHLKKITAHPYIKYTLSPVKIYELKINTGWLNGQDLFDSFPGGLFESFAGIQVAGRLNYSLNFYLDASNPDAVQFNSQMNKDNFRILKFGKTDLTKLNRPFVQTPYEVKSQAPPFTVGPANPDYTPLNEIATDTRNAIMTSEDPSFYSNNGFVEESIRKSIATDFEKKKFSRGGSTISMQLIRNTFLNRDKNLARKIEEIMLVWMIENNHLMTKDRMLEVYFNIVEFGYHIYGIGPASRYYFGKTPGQLTLGESIYLASILPNPKAGLYAFMPDGSLRPGLHGYFNLIGNLMAGHGKAQRDSNAYGFYNVRLKESLRREVSTVDTAKADSIIKQGNDDNDATPVVEPEKKLTFFQRLFGKKDTTRKAEETKNDDKATVTVNGKTFPIDTAGKTKKQIRQEKRAIKKLEGEREKEQDQKGY